MRKLLTILFLFSTAYAQEAPGGSGSIPNSKLFLRKVTICSTDNLIEYSEELNNSSYWSFFGAAGNSVAPNAINSPTTTLTADKLVESSNAGYHGIINYTPVTASTTYTASAYIKDGGRTNVFFQFNDFAGSYASIYVDVSTQVITPNGNVNWSGLSSSITNEGNGWYRVSLTATATNSHTTSLSFLLDDGSATASYTGDGTSGLYIWGAQIEQSSTLNCYKKTN